MKPFFFFRAFFGYLYSAILVMGCLGFVWAALVGILICVEPSATDCDALKLSNCIGGWGDGVYLGAITALTIGYGDFVPHTITGRSIAVLLALIGILITGIVVGAAIKALEDASREI